MTRRACLYVDTDHERRFYPHIPPDADLTDEAMQARIAFAGHFSVVFDRRLDYAAEVHHGRIESSRWAQVVPNISLGNNIISDDEWREIDAAAQAAFRYAAELCEAREKEAK